MLQAFVGIISQRGLELFCPEHPQTVEFLWRRLKRERGRVACFWSVIPEEEVGCILMELQRGHCRDALHLMQRHAREYGSLIPSDEESIPVPLHRG